MGRRRGGVTYHVGISDFRDGGEEEDDGEHEDEGRNAKVCPLHVAEIVGVRVLEEDARGEQRGHDGADSLEGLREFETELG